MAASFNESQKIDYLWKKVGYGVTKTAEVTSKEAFNESIASPLLYRGDLLWIQSDLIPTTPPASTSSIIQVYKDGSGSFSSTVECTEDLTAPDNQTWKTNLTNWVPTQFGDNYLVQVYIANSGVTNPQTVGTKIFQAGSGTDDTWFFDYQSGVLNFIGTNIPSQIGSGITGKSVYVVGYRYVGTIGIGNISSGGGAGSSAAGSNNQVQFNSNGNFDANSNFTFNSTTSVLTVTGNIVGNYFIGDGSQLTNVAASTANYANFAGNVVGSSQPNITSLGTLTNLSVTGNVTAGNVIAGNFRGTFANGNSNVNIATANGNVTIASAGNTTVTVTGTGVNVAGYITATGNIQGNFIKGDGSLLTNIGTPSSILNGTSNINIPVANGNATISIDSTSNVVIVSSAGVNVAGYLNANGNITANYFIGNGSQLTGVAKATSAVAVANGTSNVNIPTANGNVLVSVAGTPNVLTVASNGISVSGTVAATGNISGQFIIGNGSQLSGIITGTVANGTSNVNIPVANGNINFSVGNTANVVVVTPSGQNVTGNVNATYFVGNGYYLTGVDTSPANISNGTSNVNISTVNGNVTVSVAGSANIATFTSTGANISGNLSASYIIGNGSQLTGIARATVADSVANGTTRFDVPVASGNAIITVAGTANVVTVTATGVNVAGYLTTTGNVDAGVNYIKGNGYYITDIDAGTANIANSIQVGNTKIEVPIANGNISMSVSGIANVLVLSNSTMNLISTGTANLGNAVRANFFVGNGSLLTGLTTSGTANGTSNLSIPVSGGNVLVSVAGNANVLVATGTGINVAGTVNATGNITGNYFIGNGSQLTGINVISSNYANFAGNVVGAAQPNITSVGTLVSLGVTGTVTTGAVEITSTVDSTSTTTGALQVAGGVGIAKNLYVGGNLFVAGTTTTINSTVVSINDTNIVLANNATNSTQANGAGLTINGASASMNYIASTNSFTFSHKIITTGDSNLGNSVTANFILGDGGLLSNIGTATSISAVEATTGSYYLKLSDVKSGTSGTFANANLTFDAATGNLSTNIVSITGNLTAANANLGNAVRANYFIGAGNLLTNILGSSISGTVANANYSLYSGTVLTNAQPNITSVGLLANLTVGNATSNTTFGNGTVTATGNITASYFLGNGSQLTGISSAGNANISQQQALTVASTGTYFMLFGNTATGNTYVFSNANVQFDSNTGNLITTLISGTVQTANQPNIATIGNATSNHHTLGNVIAHTGNSLYLNGATTTATQTPIFNIGAGANGAALTSNDSKDRGVSVTYYSGASTTGFMGWKNANSEFVFASAATIASQVVTINTLGNIRAGNANLGNAATANYLFGTLGTFGIQPNITGVGTLSSLSVTGTVTAGNASLGNLVTANYFQGDGSLLTGIGASYNVVNGNSNVNIATANANVTISVNNTANVVTVSNTKVVVSGNVEATYFKGDGSLLTGIATGASIINGNSSIYVDANSNVRISAIGTSNVLVISNTGVTVTGNLTASTGIANLGNVGNIKITGGTNGQYLKTDGTGNLVWSTVSAGGGGGGGTSLQYTADTAPPASANPGDQWYNTTTNALYTYISDGVSSYWVDISTPTYSGNAITSLDLTDLTISGGVNLGNIANITLAGGSNGQVLTSNGSSGVSWTTPINPRAAAMVMSLIFGG